MNTPITKTMTVGLTLAATALFAAPSFAGEVKRVGSNYKSEEHNQNFQELDKRTKNQLSALKKQKKNQTNAIKRQKVRLDNALVELRGKNQQIESRISDLESLDLSQVQQDLDDLFGIVSDLTNRVSFLEDKVGSGAGVAKAGLKVIDRGSGPRVVGAFNRFRDRDQAPPTVEYDGFTYTITFPNAPDLRDSLMHVTIDGQFFGHFFKYFVDRQNPNRIHVQYMTPEFDGAPATFNVLIY